jgi:hypothetical protein
MAVYPGAAIPAFDGDELKVLVPQPGLDPEKLDGLNLQFCSAQPRWDRTTGPRLGPWDHCPGFVLLQVRCSIALHLIRWPPDALVQDVAIRVTDRTPWIASTILA